MGPRVTSTGPIPVGFKAPLDVDRDTRVDAAIHTFDQIQVPLLFLAHVLAST